MSMDPQTSGGQPKILALVATAVLVALVAISIVNGRAEEEDIAPARFDPTSGRCVGDDPVSLQRCEGELARLESTLKNAATAQESYATTNAGAYTDQIADLEAQGFQMADAIQLTVLARGGRYCLETRSQELGATMYYSSTEGTPLPGTCG
jgi:hypothetical protein